MSECIFCRIVAGGLPSKKVLETDSLLAFEDIAPKAPTHILIIPKTHVATLADASGNPALLGQLAAAAAEVARQRGLTDYRLVVNNGPEAGQLVFHLHFHLLAGRKMTWPPG